MNRRQVFALFLLVGMGVSGCILISTNRGYPPPDVVYVPVPAGSTQPAIAPALQARLQATRSMTSFTERDRALSQVALRAAAMGEAAIARQALDEMTSFTSRDNAASAAAISLANQGRREEAVEISKSMTSFSARDRTLAQLAGS